MRFVSDSLARLELDRHIPLTLGAFVRSTTNRLGTGKIHRLNGESAVIEYFHSTAKIVHYEISIAALKRVVLPPQTRCYFQRNNHWIAGRIGRTDGDQYEVDLPDGRAEYLPESLLHVRTNLPISDPTAVLAIKAHETAAYYRPRLEYLRNTFEQRAASRGLTGALSARIELLPHQMRVVHRVIEDPVQRYLLADEVGLGKTIEAGCILRQFLIDNPSGRVLVVVPALLRDQWEQELDEKFDCNGLDGEVTLTTHEEFTARTNQEASFGLIIVDEAQHLAACAFSDRTDGRNKFKALQKLTQEIPRVLLLSATPILHNEREFLAMLHLLSPDVYSLADFDSFRVRVETRQEIGRVLVGLQPHLPTFLIRGQVQKLREILSRDNVLATRLDALDESLNSANDDARAGAIRDVRAHVSEAYRLHHRMLRNRRARIESGVLIPRGSSAPGVHNRVEEWDSDERSELALDAVERWRLTMRETLNEATNNNTLSEIKTIFRILIETASTHLALFDSVVQSRLHKRPNRQLRRDFSQASVLWTVPIAAREQEVLKEMADVTKRHTTVDRIDDLVQLIRTLRSREAGKKFVVFTGYPSVCSWISERLSRLPDFQDCGSYHSDIPSDEVEDILAAFRDPTSKSDVLVCDRSGEEGRNLQFADFIIHFDLPWNPNRLEQRIGRLDRIGRIKPLRSRIFVGPDIENSLAEAWYATLRDAFGIFNRSIASLQIFADRVVPELIDIAWEQGSAAVVEHIPALKQQISEELERIAEQDILDEVESLENDESSWVSQLREFDRKSETIQKSTEGWIVGKLQFKKRWADNKLNVCTYRPSVYGTHVPFDLIYADFAYVLLDPVTYYRNAAVRYPGTQLLRVGSMFVDKMTQFVRWDDRGQAFAFWRNIRSWPQDRLWTGFVFSFVVGPDLRQAAQIAREIFNSSDLSAIRRRAEAWFPPFLRQVFVDSHAVPVQDPEILKLLRIPFRADCAEIDDTDLTGNLTKVIGDVIDPTQWARICVECKGAAHNFLASSEQLHERSKSAKERGEREWRKRTDTLEVRASYSHDDNDKLTRKLDLDMEREIGTALLRGIENPVLRVDAVGFIALSGRACAAESV